jgi:hypothetical protein
MATQEWAAVYYQGVRRRGNWPDVWRYADGKTAPLYSSPDWSGGVVIDYAWGCSGPGADLLALAILTDVLGGVSLAKCWAEQYAAEVVGQWASEKFCTTNHQVCCWLVHKTIQALRAQGDRSADLRLCERVFAGGCGAADQAHRGKGGADVN